MSYTGDLIANVLLGSSLLDHARWESVVDLAEQVAEELDRRGKLKIYD